MGVLRQGQVNSLALETAIKPHFGQIKIPRLWSRQWLGCKRLRTKVGGSEKRVEADEGSLAEEAAAEQLAAMVEHTSGTVSSLASVASLATTAHKEAAAADRLARGLSKTPGKFGALPVMEIGAIGTHFLPFRKNVLNMELFALALQSLHVTTWPCSDMQNLQGQCT